MVSTAMCLIVTCSRRLWMRAIWMFSTQCSLTAVFWAQAESALYPGNPRLTITNAMTEHFTIKSDYPLLILGIGDFREFVIEAERDYRFFINLISGEVGV